MASPLTITIGGTEWDVFTQESVEFTNTMGLTIPTLSATIYDKGSALAVPGMAQDVIVTDTVTGDRLWGGLLSLCTGRTEGISRYWDIQAQGYGILLNKTMCYASFGPGFTYTTGGTTYKGDLAILKHLFEKDIYGQNGAGSSSEIVVDPTYCQQGINALSSLSFMFSYLQEAVSLLANYVGFNFFVDPYKNLWYYSLPTSTAPYSLSSPDEGSSWQGLSVVNYRNLKWKRDFTRAANNFLVVGTAAPSFTQTMIIAGDGVSKTISVKVISENYPIGAPAGQTTILVSVNTNTDVDPTWTPQTVGLVGIDNLSSFDCLFDSVNQTLIFNTAPPNFTNAIKIWYVFTYVAGQPYPDLASISTYSRTFSQRQIASDANSTVAMQTLISHLDRQFSTPLEILTMSVADTDFPGGTTTRFSVGQAVPFHNGVLSITNIIGSVPQYFIHQIKTTVLGGTNRNYDLELRSFVLE
jgi:hypothetical protein